MPELPEVETLNRGLRSDLLGLTLARVRIFERKVLRKTTPRTVQSLRGRRILGVSRRGKFLLLHLSDGAVLLFHLKMTGKLLVLRSGHAPGPRERLRLEFAEGDRVLAFDDQRKFGYLAVMRNEGDSPVPLLDELGPDALRISRRDLRKLLQSSRRPIKSLLLDQRVIAGMGNIYTDECLYRAQIHPRQRANSISSGKIATLHLAIRRVLRRAIESGGSSVASFLDSRSTPGTFQKSHRVYGKKGQPCRRCRSTIEYFRVASRGTHYCPSCQKMPAGGS